MTTAENKTETTNEIVQSTPTVLILEPAVSLSDYCHVCLSEGERVYANECDEPLHDMTGTIIVTEVRV